MPQTKVHRHGGKPHRLPCQLPARTVYGITDEEHHQRGRMWPDQTVAADGERAPA